MPYHISKGGTRYYSSKQLKQFSKISTREKKAVGYCRVSTQSQKDGLNTQIANVKTYMYAKGYSFEIISEIGSGINYRNRGLRELIRKINNQEVSKVVILDKDKLVRFGFEFIKYLCEINDIELEIIDNSEQNNGQELIDDFIQIITVFANRLYGPCSQKTKKLIDEVKNSVESNQDKTKTN